MASDINNFKKNFAGTRPNRFKISISLPGGGNFNSLDLYGKATRIPSASSGVIPVPWMGRVVKFSGERVFEDWTVQFYDAGGEADTRAKLMQWLESMDSAKEHNINYKQVGTATVTFDDINQATGVGTHSSQGAFKRGITLHNLFPIDVGPMELSYDLFDTFSEYTVTWAYDFFEYGTASGGNVTPVGPLAPAGSGGVPPLLARP